MCIYSRENKQTTLNSPHKRLNSCLNNTYHVCKDSQLKGCSCSNTCEAQTGSVTKCAKCSYVRQHGVCAGQCL